VTNDHTEIAAFATDLAARSGRRLLTVLNEPQEVEFKDERKMDPVTALDREIEAMLQEAILSRFPDHAILGEEGAAASSDDAPYLWALDPIDGTTNFLNGLPLFAVSIGVLSEGLPVAAAMFLATGPGARPGVIYAARAHGASFQPLGSEEEPHASHSPARPAGP
jgi:myo-inositol-1(or 4)-monophosphatase